MDRILDADPGYKGPSGGDDHPLKKVVNLPFEGKNKEHYEAQAAKLQAEFDAHAAAMASGSAAAAAAAIGGRYSVVADAAGHPKKPKNAALVEGSDSVEDLALKLYQEDQRQAGIVMTAGQLATEVAVSAPLVGAGVAATKAAFSTAAPTRMARIVAGAKPPPPPTPPPGGKLLTFPSRPTTASPSVTSGASGGASSSGTGGVIDFPTTIQAPRPPAPVGPQNVSAVAGAADDTTIQIITPNPSISGNLALAPNVKPIRAGMQTRVIDITPPPGPAAQARLPVAGAGPAIAEPETGHGHRDRHRHGDRRRP